MTLNVTSTVTPLLDGGGGGGGCTDRTWDGSETDGFDLIGTFEGK